MALLDIIDAAPELHFYGVIGALLVAVAAAEWRWRP